MPSDPEPPPFVPFSRHLATRTYQHNLPHWRQNGATYFVTFRLGDSLPAPLIDELREGQRRWLKSRGITWDRQGLWHKAFETLPVSDRYQYYKTFNRQVQGHLDKGYGSCLLRSSRRRAIAEDAMTHFHQKRFWLGDCILMPSHVHALMTPLGGHELEDILGSLKKCSARRINAARKRTGERVWQKESYDHIVRDLSEASHFRDYIADNPRKARLKAGEFTYVRAEWMDEWMR